MLKTINNPFAHGGHFDSAIKYLTIASVLVETVLSASMTF